MTTHRHPSLSLDKDGKGQSNFEKEFRGMIRFLLYITTSRHDIVFLIVENSKNREVRYFREKFGWLSTC